MSAPFTVHTGNLFSLIHPTANCLSHHWQAITEMEYQRFKSTHIGPLIADIDGKVEPAPNRSHVGLPLSNVVDIFETCAVPRSSVQPVGGRDGRSELREDAEEAEG